jgi:hypothetical protein
MGYRVRLGKVDKREQAQFVGMSYGDIQLGMDMENYAPYRPKFHTQLYEMGGAGIDLTEHTSHFYVSCSGIHQFDDGESEFLILTKEGLAVIIDTWRGMIVTAYKQKKLDILIGNIDTFIDSRIATWDKKHTYSIVPYYLDEEHKDGAIVRAWDIEYSIFNLVHIYQTFDWETDYLIYSGW